MPRIVSPTPTCPLQLSCALNWRIHVTVYRWGTSRWFDSRMTQGNSQRKHFVFLRGINVGGVRVPMPQLHEVFTDLGATNVKTWLATGNVRVEFDGSASELKTLAEKALSERFEYEAYVLVRSRGELRTAIASWPFKPQRDAHRYLVFGGAVAHPEVDAALLGASGQSHTTEKSGPAEQVAVAGGDLFWICPKGSTTTSVVSKVLNTRAYKAVTTTRNLNTVEKMLV